MKFHVSKKRERKSDVLKKRMNNKWWERFQQTIINPNDHEMDLERLFYVVWTVVPVDKVNMKKTNLTVMNHND